VKLKAKLFTYQSKLPCNQANVGCGSNAKEQESPDVLLQEQRSLSVYPNPTNGEVFLSLDVVEPGEYKIVVSDVSGKVLLHFNKILDEGIFIEQLNIRHYRRVCILFQLQKDLLHFINVSEGIKAAARHKSYAEVMIVNKTIPGKIPEIVLFSFPNYFTFLYIHLRPTLKALEFYQPQLRH
jgi:hypothetical protein